MQQVILPRPTSPTPAWRSNRCTDRRAKWAALGCEVLVASVEDTDGMTEAFRGVDGVFLMPPNYDPEPGFPDTLTFNAVRPNYKIDATGGIDSHRIQVFHTMPIKYPDRAPRGVEVDGTIFSRKMERSGSLSGPSPRLA